MARREVERRRFHLARSLLRPGTRTSAPSSGRARSGDDALVWYTAGVFSRGVWWVLWPKTQAGVSLRATRSTGAVCSVNVEAGVRGGIDFSCVFEGGVRRVSGWGGGVGGLPLGVSQRRKDPTSAVHVACGFIGRVPPAD